MDIDSKNVSANSSIEVKNTRFTVEFSKEELDLVDSVLNDSIINERNDKITSLPEFLGVDNIDQVVGMLSFAAENEGV